MNNDGGLTVQAKQTAVEAGPLVTVLEGSTFCLSGWSGDVEPATVQGLFFHDTRIVSTWRLLVNGRPLQLVSAMCPDPYRAVFLSRASSSDAGLEVLVERRRYVGHGMREDLRVRNFASTPVLLALWLEVDADLADLFAVKESRVIPDESIWARPQGSTLVIGNDRRRGVRIDAARARATPTGLEFQIEVPARGDWTTSILVHPVVDDQVAANAFPVERPIENSLPALRRRAWRSANPTVQVTHVGLQRTLEQSQSDLGALRIFDPAHPDSVVVAAGAPWFMALFGRDSLLSSYMALPLDPTLALGTLQSLARAQGSSVDPRTEEQPGRILHETRLGQDFPLSRGGGSVYYGTVDATPLFVVLLGELRRWGIASVEVDALLPHADRALEWVEHHGDRDGDGFVEYERMTEHGLRNQGWKDTTDGVNFADGRIAEPPIALCEVQAYVYAAYRARARFAAEAGQAQVAGQWRAKAAELQRAFHERFWLPDRGWFAVGLDKDKQPIDALTSNMGHCLWLGLIDEDKAAAVADRLMSPDMFTGWGVRTLAASMGAYNPMSYHNGSVWPHDNALIASGLMRYGFVEKAQRLAAGILDAAEAFGGRLPELFCGFDRSEYVAPIPYPTSCSPQAWASAAPIQLLRALLRLEPAMPRRTIWFAPEWPRRYGSLIVRQLSLGGGMASARVGDAWEELSGLDSDIQIRREPRPATHDSQAG